MKSNQHNLQIWMNDCRTCKTYSRLYVLMMIFENSIAWNKSTIGIKCKICRKKNKDEYIIVCDQCCQGYHLECLRGYELNNAKNSINDLWYCPACRPQSISRRRRYEKQDEEEKKSKIDYYDADIYDMDVDTTSNISSHISDLNSEQSQTNNNNDIDQSNEENLCSICAVETSDDNELIQCIQCRSLFHCQCHEPPLRCPPRSTTWMCNSCRNGINNPTNNLTRRVQTRRQIAIRKSEQKSRIQPQRQNGTRRTVRKNYREIDEDEDEDEDEIYNDNDNDESDYEQETRNQRRSKRLRRLSPPSTNDTMDKSDENYDIRPTRRRVRIAKSSSSSSSTTDSDEEQILADIHDDDDESNMEQDEDDVEREENGNIEDTLPSSQ